MDMKFRSLSKIIDQIQKGERGRLLVLTGARQTGKTTLAKRMFPDYPLLSMEDPHVRVEFEKLSSRDWATRYPRAVIDEIQKLPSLFEVIKACYDTYPETRYLLLGSSQILLLKKVKESLAGRVTIQELFPLTLPEILSRSWEDEAASGKIVRIARAEDKAEILSGMQEELSTNENFSKSVVAWQKYLRIGGMPALYNPSFSEEDLRGWMEDYLLTYLQRDLSDLAQMDRLEPFVKSQKALALKSSQTVNFSDLARLSDISPPTARRFLQYMELSYQILQLPAYFQNEEKRLSKMPKIHFIDPGIRRGILKKTGEVEGNEFESAVVSEIYKQLKMSRVPCSLYHLRTADQREVDLLIEMEHGIIAVECKMTNRVSKGDFRHLAGLSRILTKPILAGLVVAEEPRVQIWDREIPLISLPAPYLLS